MTPFGNVAAGNGADNGNRDGQQQFANKTQNFEVVAQYQFDFGLRPSIAYLQSKGKDLNGFTKNGSTYGGGDADLVKYVEVGTYYYFNKNMSTYVDYKINLLDDNSYTKAAGRSTADTVGVGLQYQFEYRLTMHLRVHQSGYQGRASALPFAFMSS